MRERNERLAFLAWGDFLARSCFARSTIPEEKWGLLVVHKKKTAAIFFSTLILASSHNYAVDGARSK